MMNFYTKKDAFEKKLAEGVNYGEVLIKKIPVKLQENVLYTLSLLMETKPKNVDFKGLYYGFARVMMLEKQKRMQQIKAVEQAQIKAQSKER